MQNRNVDLTKYEKQPPPRFVSINHDATAAIDVAGKAWERLCVWPENSCDPFEAWMCIDIPALVKP